MVCRAIDGDTLACNGEVIRLVGVDTPERRGAKCPEEALLAGRAKERMEGLLLSGKIEIRRETKLAALAKKDRYGRTLAHVLIDGRNVSEFLISEGLGRKYDGGTRQGWCEQ